VDARSRSRWRRELGLGSRNAVLGAAGGVALVGVLVPILLLVGGNTGSLGPSIPLFFLVPVLLTSALTGRGAGALVSFVAIFAWDWFFIPPIHMVTVYAPRDVLALLIFLMVALLTGQLATAARRRAEDAILRARSSEALHELSTALIAHHQLADTLAILTRRIHQTFELDACAVLLKGADGAGWHTAAVAGDLPTNLAVETSRDVAGVVQGASTSGRVIAITRDGAAPRQQNRSLGIHRSLRGARFLPLRVESRTVGVLELIERPGTELNEERDRLLATFANGAAIALEQSRLARDEQEAQLARASDELKSALLSSVSHDLRTPLAGIKAAASSLLQEDVDWSAEDRREFAMDIDQEADRLTRLVSNLLDLSRIEAGAMQLEREWEDAADMIGRVVRRLERSLRDHPVSVNAPQSLPPVWVDVVRIEQVLVNLVENAAKYSPAGAAIVLQACFAGQDGGTTELRIAVHDQGRGIPAAEQERIFDKFYRLSGSMNRPAGTGLGLSIARGFVEAHGGRIEIESATGEGSTFTVVLPLEPAPIQAERIVMAEQAAR